jgi:hypothetical protein
MSLFDVVPLVNFLKRLALGRRQPIAQPVPDVTSSDVERVVRRDFAKEQFAGVMTLLDECGAKNAQRGGPRVQLAALKLAQGSVEKLKPLVESAKRDYRDVLVWAEYPNYHKIGFRVRELPNKERRRIIDSDWKQYEGWLRQ